MTNKAHTYTLLATLLVLTALFSGCARQSKAAATNLPAADYRKDAHTLTKEAYELIQKDELQLAIAKAELAVQKDPNFGEARKNLALAYCDSGRIQDALAPAQAAVRLSPDLDKAHFVLGKVLVKLERRDEAIPELQQAIRLNAEYEKAYFMLGITYDLMNKPDEAQVALDKWVQLNHDNYDYRSFRDSFVAYTNLKKNGTPIPKLIPIEGMPHEYTRGVYSGILYEALVHRDFELIESAANEARASKEKLPGGVWKLQLIYAGLDQPYWPRSDFEWKQHISLLQQWIKDKPNSITAKVALASCQNHFAWNARGTGYANTVSDENQKLFVERLKETEKILWSARGEKMCPMWYSVMQQVALAEGWDRESYESLFADSIAQEPTFYDYYRQKLIYLLPQWHGAPGELEAYMNSFAVRHDNADSAMLHFMLNESLGSFEPNERDKPSAYYSVLKQGYFDLRKAYGVTQRDQNWIFHKAMATNDRAFAEQLFPEVQNAGLPLRVDKQMFEAAVKASESSKH